MIPALYLDRMASRYKRYNSRRKYLLIAIAALLLSIFGPRLSPVLGSEWIVRLSTAISLFAFSGYVWKCMLEGYWLSLYARSRRSGEDYWTAFAQQYGLLKLPFAYEALARLGLSAAFFKGIELKGNGKDFALYAASIFTDNQDARALLESHGVTKAYWTGVWTWLEKIERENIEASYVLSDEHLRKLSSIGEAFSYGQIYTLTKIGRKLVGLTLPQSLDHFYSRAFSLFEQSLKKSQGANVIIISQSVEDGEEYVRAFIPHFDHKRFIEIATEELVSIKDVQEFEKVFTKSLSEAAHAGDIVLVIPHIASLLSAAHIIGYDAALTLTEFMRNPDLHIVMIADRQEYHATLETNISLIQAADKIELDVLAPDILQSVAESEVLKTEYRHGVLFSYQALSAIVDAVNRYGSDRLHDTLRDYLDEAAIYVHKKNKESACVTEEIAKEFIAEKTGTQGTFADITVKAYPIGIKETLSRRVRGQDKAIEAVAMALERVRAGLSSKHRPLGTFLFLGPTGVGKTETAKALAEAYFGTEEKMMRLDMTEFSDANALSHLIGAFGVGEAGVLAAKARDKGHGVILFDEIEKAHEKVHNLMLQILDEGYFTDARSNKVNMKNFIMIATSNAGSSEIYQAYTEGKMLDKKAVIQHIINKGIFKPEFLNRFDEIAVFNPLAREQLREVAALKVAAYARELYEKKAIHMTISPDILEYIVDSVDNNAFGGREIQRVIQHGIESLIARDILSGAAQAGKTVSFAYNKEQKQISASYT